MEDYDADAACKMLRDLRENNVRDSSRIVELGETIVKKKYNFGDEFWLICEQVFIAALDVGRTDLSIICLKRLERQFPDSDRVKKLQGMDLEASGEYEAALKHYGEMEKRDPTNAAIRKRRAAIFKAEGKISEAIKCVSDYLKIFMADTEAWLELSDLYIEELEFSKAAFCLEEVILAQPRNHLFHQRYAEIKYSQGGMDNIKIAKDYFAEAVFLSNKTNMRALYGLILSCTRLHGGKNEDKKNYKKYINWAFQAVAQKHKESGQDGTADRNRSEDLDVVNAMLGKMSLT